MLSRRHFLELPLAGALVGCIGDDRPGRFTCGVASGDPTQTSVVLWTRLDGETDRDVRWVVARDPELNDVVALGSVVALEEHDWCVKVVVDELDADTEYFYAFHIANEQSNVGRTRTAPKEREQLRFAVVSCASVGWGFFHSYRHIAQRDDIDAVLHLGDYIYEYRTGRYGDVRACEPATETVYAAIAARSPHVRFVELTQRGYVDLSLNEMDVTATFLAAPDVAQRRSDQHTIAAVMISERDQPHWKS